MAKHTVGGTLPSAARHGMMRSMTQLRTNLPTDPWRSDRPTSADLAALAMLFNQGRLPDAAARARELAAAFPREPFCRKALCAALLALGRPQDLPEAAKAGAEAAALTPNDPQIHATLGAALAALARPAEAEASLRRALDLQPDFPEALANLGGLLLAGDRPAEAEPPLRRAAELAPNDARMAANLASALTALFRFVEAEAICRRAVDMAPNLPAAHNNLGMALNGQRRFAEAEPCFRRAITLKPGYPEALNNLGNALLELARPTEAEQCLRESLATRPHDAKTLSNLANVLHAQGQLPEAETLYRQAIGLKPQNLSTRSNLLFALSHDSATGPQDYLAEARDFGRVATSAGPAFTSWLHTEAAPVRVGLVSGDLREHPVGHFLEAWLPLVAPAEVEFLAYPTTPDEDALTARLKPHITAWRPIHGLTDAEAATRIHGDAVDILLDLSGHTAGNRLGVFALRPAPVQCAWLGYFASTGVEQMDFLLADAIGVPPDEENRYLERVLRLPDTRLCFAPPRDAPGISALPAATAGHVTFGCHQNPTKIGDATLDLWARALDAVPSARLRLRNRLYGDPTVIRVLVDRLGNHGVDAARVECLPGLDRAAYLADHAHVDIILDTFPYPGGTTTCEALWMGIPTLTLRGGGLLARQGASLLSAAGLPDWIAGTPDEYATRAAAFAADIPALAALRHGLRAHVAASPLFDAPRFARAFTDAMRQMWGGRKA